MAASGLPKPNSGPIPLLARAPSCNQSFQRTPSRRVYFSEIPPKPESEIPPKPETHNWDSSDRRQRRRCGKLCCTWTSVFCGCAILVLFLIGVVYISFLQGILPEFRIKRINILKLEIVRKDQEATVNADIQLLFKDRKSVV